MPRRSFLKRCVRLRAVSGHGITGQGTLVIVNRAACLSQRGESDAADNDHREHSDRQPDHEEASSYVVQLREQGLKWDFVHLVRGEILDGPLLSPRPKPLVKVR